MDRFLVSFLLLLSVLSVRLTNGMDFVVQEKLPVEVTGYPVIKSVADLDGDGALDAVLAGYWNGPGYAIVERDFDQWRQRTLIAEGNYVTVGVADLDGDSLPEIISMQTRGDVRIREATTDNTYTIVGSRTYSYWIENIAVGDSNGNGKDEFLIAREDSPPTVQILESTGDNAYTDIGPVLGTGSHNNCYVAGTADFDGDGQAELVFTQYTFSSGTHYTHVYEGGVLKCTIANFAAVSVADTDGNGKPEIVGRTYIENNWNQCRIFESIADNSFQEVFSTNAYFWTQDLDGDGRSELTNTTTNDMGYWNVCLAYTRSGQTLTEVWNSGTLLQDSTNTISTMYPMGDTDNDRLPEIAVLQRDRLVILERVAPLVITSFNGNGALTWQDGCDHGYHTVEWASTPTGVWYHSWADLINLAATGGTNTVTVPMFYRVRWTPDMITP